ncbi:MAG TPA: type II toxin-antitoxin system RelE/ParE family toxin [Paludibacter sp.]|nr:type II toxin-antitoxin system RelE/ParE family toxin [Paludibacter sp.]
MSYNIIPTYRFEKELKRLVKKYPSLKNEFAKFIQDIILKPTLGIPIGNHCYKIRISIVSKGKGKSGGARAISYLYVESETVYLLTIYDKSEKEDLKPNELKVMIENLELD